MPSSFSVPGATRRITLALARRLLTRWRQRQQRRPGAWRGHTHTSISYTSQRIYAHHAMLPPGSWSCRTDLFQEGRSYTRHRLSFCFGCTVLIFVRAGRNACMAVRFLARKGYQGTMKTCNQLLVLMYDFQIVLQQYIWGLRPAQSKLICIAPSIMEDPPSILHRSMDKPGY